MDFQELFQGWQPPEKDIVGKTYDLYKKFEEWKKPKSTQEAKAMEWFDRLSSLGSGITTIKNATFATPFDKAIAAFRNSGDAGWKSRSTLANISPEDFLNMAEFLPYSGDVVKNARVASILKEGKDFELPELFFTLDKTGKNAYVTGHEGRHRAMAMLQAGEKDYPVRLTSQPGFESGATIRWGETPKRPGFEWPEWLYGEGLNKDKRIPFPRSLFDY